MLTRPSSSIARTLGAAVLVALCAAPSTTSAMTRGACSMELLIDGRAVTELTARGTTYVEARPNVEYSIRLTNRTGERIAVALAVDGLNSIDARRTAARDASKWVLQPWQTLEVAGWQTGIDVARRFVFTTEPGSYGAWLGHTDDLGVIEAAVFRERRPLPQPSDIATRSAPAAPEAAGKARREAATDTAEGLAATGIGEELSNPVRRVRFDAEASPSAQLRIRYEYRPQLVALGVLDDANGLARRERARGFEDVHFAPDPYPKH